MYNLTPVLKSNLEPSTFFYFFFLRRTSDDFLLLLNLRMVRSPLILWQSSRSSGPQGTSISFKMLHTVAWRFLSLAEPGMPTISRHSLLLIVPEHVNVFQVLWHNSKAYHLQFWSQQEMIQLNLVYLISYQLCYIKYPNVHRIFPWACLVYFIDLILMQ